MKKRGRKKRTFLSPDILKKGGIAAGIILVIILAIIVIANNKKEYAPVDFTGEAPDGHPDSLVIADGIYIGKTYVGGMTKEDARDAISDACSISAGQSVTVNWNDAHESATLDSLGINWGINKAINSALDLTYGGGILQRYKTSVNLKNISYHIELAKTLSKELVDQFITDNISSRYDIKPTDAKLSYKDGGLYVTEAKIGKKTDIGRTSSAILNAFYNLSGEESIIVDAVISDDYPEKTTEMLSEVTDCLGKYTTVYLKDDGRERTDRCINVEVATKYINGTILMPGESASTSKLMKERNVENGYAMGGQYVNGQLEDAIGGGVCQVASTLYNALLKSEIQIDKRYNHSLLVSYVDPSHDAAIANGSKDLRFTNNTEYPIYLYGHTDGHNVTFKVYGHECRDASRTIKFMSVTEKRIESKDIIVEDDKLFVGEKETIGTTHDECWSHLEKIVYENGTEVSRQTLHSDYYMPSQATVHVGTKPKPEEPLQTESPADSSEQQTGHAQEDN